MSDTSAFKLIIEDDGGRRSVVPVELGQLEIGRLESNTIRLDERNVSRQHARLVKEKGSVFAEDLDSFNGVWVNGDRVQGRQEIHDGDLIRIGDFQLELRGQGLQRRTEETTQRTLMPQRDSTQPEIRMGESTPAASSAQPDPPASRDAARPAPGTDESPARGATAIIRLDAPESHPARGQSGAIAGQKAKLVCVSTLLAGRELEIGKTEVVIGRTSDNDICLDHRSVSRHHAKIVVVGNRRYVLHDLKSANGTLVNGEAYAQTELERGDLIELGHVKLRFVPPGETYTLAADELAAVRAPSAIGDEPTSMPGRRVPLGVVFAGVVALVGLLVVIGLLVFGGNRTSAQSVPADAHAASESDALLGRAQLALAQRRWDQAASLANEVLAADPGREAARELVAKAEAERRAQASYEQATKAVEAGDWRAARGALENLPPASVYADQSRALAARVKGALVADLAAKARAALEAKRLEEAEGYAGEIARIDASHEEAAQLRAEIERRSRRHAGAPPTTPRPQTATPRRNPLAGDSTAAVPTTPAAASPAPIDPSAVYAEAAALIRAGDVGAAIEALNRCIQAEPGYALCYRALGIAYARAGNTPKAAKYYKQYLKVAPSAPDADKVRQLLERYETAP